MENLQLKLEQFKLKIKPILNECLDKIERQLKLVVDNGGKIPFQYDIKNVDVETESFWYGGTIANSETRGSSLIGDGLARRSFFIA